MHCVRTQDLDVAWKATPTRLLVVVALVLTVAGCANRTPKATPKPSAGASTSDSVPRGTATTTTTGTVSTTTAPSAFANLYLQILGPADAATGEFFTALKALSSTATGADAQKVATPAADAIDAADHRLLEVSWPGTVARDIKALVFANAQLVGDMRELAAQNRVTFGAWKNQFESDVATVTNSANLIRTDLTAPHTSK